jgi:hypothetical protein
VLGATSLGAAVAVAASLEVAPGTLALFVLPPPTPPTIGVEVDITPESLQQRSQGVPVFAVVTFPVGVDADAVDPSSLRLCVGTTHCGAEGVAPTNVGAPGSDPDGAERLRLRFSRGAVIELVADVPKPSTVLFTVSGTVLTVPFAGLDDVRLLGASGTQGRAEAGDQGTNEGEAPTSPTPSTAPSPSAPPSPPVSPGSSESPSPDRASTPPGAQTRVDEEVEAIGSDRS